MKNHSLIHTLLTLTGNPRGCVYTEPLWGIPFNLYIPYASVYMVALGLSDKEIGLIASVSLGFQVVFALLSGVVTDKLGRRLTTLIFDIISWSVPALISAIAQNFWYFLIAAVINSVWRVTHNSWNCLLVEDADPAQLVDIYSWIYIANLVVGLVAPLAGLLISTFTLAPTMRGLYLFAAVMFTIKAIVTYRMTQETAQGVVRMHETSQQNVFHILSEYGDVLRKILHSPQTLYTAGIMLIMGISATVNGNFWAILLTEKLLVPDWVLSIFPFVKSAIMITFFFLIMPRISTMHFKVPMLLGFLGYILSLILLITAPEQGYFILLASVFLEAFSFATVSPLLDRMTVLTVDAKERARILSILYVGIILLTSPFGWIAGELSSLDKNLPFIMNIGLFAIGAILAIRAGWVSQKALADQADAAAAA